MPDLSVKFRDYSFIGCQEIRKKTFFIDFSWETGSLRMRRITWSESRWSETTTYLESPTPICLFTVELLCGYDDDCMYFTLVSAHCKRFSVENFQLSFFAKIDVLGTKWGLNVTIKFCNPHIFIPSYLWPPNSLDVSITRCGGSYKSVCTSTTGSRTWKSCASVSRRNETCLLYTSPSPRD